MFKVGDIKVHSMTIEERMTELFAFVKEELAEKEHRITILKRDLEQWKRTAEDWRLECVLLRKVAQHDSAMDF